mgnify:CR=1 FL=1
MGLSHNLQLFLQILSAGLIKEETPELLTFPRGAPLTQFAQFQLEFGEKLQL